MNPLDGVINESWRLYKSHALHLIIISLLIYLVAAIIAALLALVGGFIGAFLGSIIEVIAAFLVQAALVKAVQDVRDGRVDLTVGETVRAALPFIGPVAIVSILAGIAIVIGLLLIIVPGLWLMTIWAVIVPVVVLEQTPALSSFGRSRALVRGRGWNVFGVLVLVFVILLVFKIIVGLVLLALPAALAGFLSTVISGAVVGPFLAVVTTLVYYRLRDTAPGVPGPMPPPV